MVYRILHFLGAGAMMSFNERHIARITEER